MVTAAGFAALSIFNITALGWAGGIALALTAARPLGRFYAYTMSLLARTSQRVRFPADDVRDVKDRLLSLEAAMTALDRTQEHSWAYSVDRETTRLSAKEVQALRLQLERANEEKSACPSCHRA
ncbi:MAG: hypothetical protein R3E66_19405 [bacterium]